MRSPSQSSSTSGAKLWKIGPSLRRKPSEGGREDEDGDQRGGAPAQESAAESNAALPIIVSAHNDSNHRQLREFVQRIRAAPSNPAHVDTTFKEFTRIRAQCAALVRALLSPQTGAAAAAAADPEPALSQSDQRSSSSRQQPKKQQQRAAESVYAKVGVVPWQIDPRDSVPVTGPGARRFLTEAGKGRAAGGGTAGGGGGRPTTSQGEASRTGRVNGAYLGAIRDWKECLEVLADMHRTSLERDPWPDIGDALDTDKKFRVHVALRSKSETRLRNYEAVKAELADITGLLQAGESGIALGRTIREYAIAPRGDAVLEFANTATDWKPVLRFRVSSHMLAETSPIFARMFRGDDYVDYYHGGAGEDEGGGGGGGGGPDTPGAMGEVTADELPPAPSSFVAPDGVAVKLFRMLQQEHDREESLSVLLHAAHMHNDRVPRDVSFEQFVALAEVCLRYRCTSPLEVLVEHRWMPQWMHKATEEMPDGLLLISYVFGIRRLFTRMTKTVIMNVVSEREIAEKNWPAKVKDRIRAICAAKRAQIYHVCLAAVDECLRPPPPPPPTNDHLSTAIALDPPTSFSTSSSSSLSAYYRSSPLSAPTTAAAATTNTTTTTTPYSSSTNYDWNRDSLASTIAAPSSARTLSTPPLPRPVSQMTITPPSAGPLTLGATPRCPKGSHWCDATNLGWLMLVLHELQLLGPVLHPAALAAHPPPPPRSLAQLVGCLSSVPSPPHPVHAAQRAGGVCDPAPALRSAANDIYNSVSGLTLFDITGRHGWGLSRHKRDLPQAVLRLRVGRGRGRAHDLPEPVCARLLECAGAAGGLGDLRALALVNRRFYDVYRRFEGRLVAGVLGVEFGEGGKRKGRRAEKEGDRGEEYRGGRGGNEGKDAVVAEEDEDEDEEDEEDHEEQEEAQGDQESDDLDGETEVYYEIEDSVGRESRLSGTADEMQSPGRTPTEDEADTDAIASDFAIVPPMTDEEARRILWPETDPDPDKDPALLATSPGTNLVNGGGGDGLAASEKLRLDDDVFVEDKTLVISGQKQLRDERDRVVGLFPKTGGGGEPGSRPETERRGSGGGREPEVRASHRRVSDARGSPAANWQGQSGWI